MSCEEKEIERASSCLPLQILFYIYLLEEEGFLTIFGPGDVPGVNKSLIGH